MDAGINSGINSDTESEDYNTTTHTTVTTNTANTSNTTTTTTNTNTTTVLATNNNALDYTIIHTDNDTTGLPSTFIFNPSVFNDINEPITNYFEDNTIPVVNDTETDSDNDN